MNKKGFTLVELLAVIIIIGLLATLTTVSVAKILNDAKNDLSDVQIKSILSAARTWGADNMANLPDDGECIYITLKDLKDYGLLDSNVFDPKDGSNISDDLKVKISTEKNSFDKLITNYEVNPNSVDGCTKFSE